jgi:hypothetical protein
VRAIGYHACADPWYSINNQLPHGETFFNTIERHLPGFSLMAFELTGACSAKVDSGLATESGESILIESILLPLTGFHLGGQGFCGCARRGGDFASPKQIA